MDKLCAILTKHNIPVDRWGMGSAKTYGHLKKEVEEGETVLEESPTGLRRLTTVLYVDVLHTTAEGKTLRLYEDHQRFTDGRVRRRSLKGSIAEKLKRGEAPTRGAVLRALHEELGVKAVSSAEHRETREVEEESASYPGLWAVFTEHLWQVTLPDAEYRPEGYEEVQPDKTTRFLWREAL